MYRFSTFLSNTFITKSNTSTNHNPINFQPSISPKIVHQLWALQISLTKLSKLVRKQPQCYNEAFEIQICLLNNSFPYPLTFCQQDTEGPHHLIFQCPKVKKPHYFATSDMICKNLSEQQWKEVNLFIDFLLFAQRKYYKLHQKEECIEPNEQFIQTITYLFQYPQIFDQTFIQFPGVFSKLLDKLSASYLTFCFPTKNLYNYYRILTS